MVTGSAGFIGAHVVDRLLTMRKNVAGIDNLDPFYDPPIKMRNMEHSMDDDNFIFYRVNIRGKDQIKKVFGENNIDAVIHLAAGAGVRLSIQDPPLYADVNINGTINLLELSKEQGIKNFVFGSSSSVYGVNEKIPLSEQDAVERMISPYAASKRDYTYISDVVDGIITTLDKKFGYEMINPGNSDVVELRYLIRLIEENLGEEARIKQLPDQIGAVPVTYADISKARRLPGYNPRVSIEEGIERFGEWYRSTDDISCHTTV